MAFSLDRFYRLNRRALIWLILFALLWLSRDFFALVFLTYLLAFIAYPAVRLVETRIRLPYRLSLIAWYALLLAALVFFVSLLTPKVIYETNRFAGNLESMQRRLVELKDGFVEQYPGLERPLLGYMRSALDDESLGRVDAELAEAARALGVEANSAGRHLAGAAPSAADPSALERLRALEEDLVLDSLLAQQGERLREHIPRLINGLYRATVTLLMAMLFSFLVLFDLNRLREQVKSLRNSRLVDFYEEAAQPVVRFAYVVGRALRAQAIIALINTLLTTLALVFLGIPSITMLALIVFLCSFVPVLGVFISTTPIVLVALNSGGIGAAIAVVAVVVIVHAVEAYVLNPVIYGRQFKLNPVLVLFVLFIGYHAFGIWGMVIGVPVTMYLLQDVFGVELFRRSAAGTGAPAGP